MKSPIEQPSLFTKRFQKTVPRFFGGIISMSGRLQLTPEGSVEFVEFGHFPAVCCCIR